MGPRTVFGFANCDFTIRGSGRVAGRPGGGIQVPSV